MSHVVQVHDVHVSLGESQVLAGIALYVHAGESIAVEGASGAGKSTLMHVIAGLIRPESGSVEIGSRRIEGLSDRRRSAVRLRAVGSVFQFGELLPEFNVVENVELPLRLLARPRSQARRQAMERLREVGIDDLAERSLSQISGGQMQRAAIARAVVHEPDAILADEPTGSLDDKSANVVMELLIETSHRHGAALIVATHDHSVSARCDRTAQLLDGTLHEGTTTNVAT